jgi:hypothetical protein
MFTWEEAGLLRQMIQIAIWAVILVVVLAVVAVKGELIAAGARAAFHLIQH